VWEWELKWYRFFHANNRILAIGRIEKQPNTWHGTKARLVGSEEGGSGGKTTLVRSTFPKLPYFNLEAPNTR
jgi:hypothetical protein